jgi:hypothetical protein
MKIEPVISSSNISFKSGYPTFGTNGHLNKTPASVYDNVYIGYRPTSDILKGGLHINYQV